MESSTPPAGAAPPTPPAGGAPPTLTDAVARLNGYWTQQGCAVMQPYNTEVGAGTLNPATFLRVLGPEPWRVAYVEPSVRPDDARYGENPNRLQTHTQYQVVLKAEPGDSQDLYLGSLAALGIDMGAHDVRFVEDNWASPALGAWGLGWEVWLDGLEITQFTYFQQAGGFSLDPVSVELTYGLERIVMALQGVRHFKDIAYAGGLSYGAVFGQAEYEWSRYYLDDADVEEVGGMFAAYEREAQRMIAERLPVPAYSYVLKCSHTFNILDSRGAVSPTERARSFARMRRLAHQVAELWVERREEEGFPVGRAGAPEWAGATGQPHPTGRQDNPGEAPLPVGDLAPSATDTGPADLAFEIGVEELPAADVQASAHAVRADLAARLAATHLSHGAITVHASPRRIAALVASVSRREHDRDEMARGPRQAAAFDADGNPTRAAEGFARANGVSVSELTTTEVKGVVHLAHRRHVAGRAAPDVLGDVLAGVVANLRSSDKNMRWNAPGLSFARPIRWVLALLGTEVVPVTVANLVSGRTTFVHRSDPRPRRDVASAERYMATLDEADVVVDRARRRELIRDQVVPLAKEAGGTAELDDALLEEVTDLVEGPNAVAGHFDPDYLELPAPVLVTVMRKHQRYFPVRSDPQNLLPTFVAVANGPCDHDVVRAGNESVLRARYEDARFFWSQDLKRRPEKFRADLERLTFAEGLGSMGDRATRIGRIALALHDELAPADPGGQTRATLERAAALVKFDLATQMVTELTSLAGVMGREYALRSGEPPAVADALFEEELPRHSADALPDTTAGALLSVADRVDLLAGLFAAGAEPTGSSDPYAMRRAALGLLAVLGARPELRALGVDRALDVAGAAQPLEWSDDVRRRALDFVARRWETQQLDAGIPADPVRAVRALARRPAEAADALAWLVEHRDDADFTRVARALGRASRIVKPDVASGWDPASAAEPAEDDLRAAVEAFAAALTNRGPDATSLPEFVAAAGEMVEPIDRFFDDVLVMVDDEAVRANRLGLLAAIRDLAAAVIDWTALD
jgi:glycyl-tRNA synthetase